MIEKISRVFHEYFLEKKRLIKEHNQEQKKKITKDKALDTLNDDDYDDYLMEMYLMDLIDL